MGRRFWALPGGASGSPPAMILALADRSAAVGVFVEHRSGRKRNHRALSLCEGTDSLKDRMSEAPQTFADRVVSFLQPALFALVAGGFRCQTGPASFLAHSS